MLLSGNLPLGTPPPLPASTPAALGLPGSSGSGKRGGQLADYSAQGSRPSPVFGSIDPQRGGRHAEAVTPILSWTAAMQSGNMEAAPLPEGYATPLAAALLGRDGVPAPAAMAAVAAGFTPGAAPVTAATAGRVPGTGVVPGTSGCMGSVVLDSGGGDHPMSHALDAGSGGRVGGGAPLLPPALHGGGGGAIRLRPPSTVALATGATPGGAGAWPWFPFPPTQPTPGAASQLPPGQQTPGGASQQPLQQQEARRNGAAPTPLGSASQGGGPPQKRQRGPSSGAGPEDTPTITFAARSDGLRDGEGGTPDLMLSASDPGSAAASLQSSQQAPLPSQGQSPLPPAGGALLPPPGTRGSTPAGCGGGGSSGSDVPVRSGGSTGPGRSGGGDPEDVWQLCRPQPFLEVRPAAAPAATPFVLSGVAPESASPSGVSLAPHESAEAPSTGASPPPVLQSTQLVAEEVMQATQPVNPDECVDADEQARVAGRDEDRPPGLPPPQGSQGPSAFGQGDCLQVRGLPAAPSSSRGAELGRGAAARACNGGARGAAQNAGDGAARRRPLGASRPRGAAVAPEPASSSRPPQPSRPPSDTAGPPADGGGVSGIGADHGGGSGAAGGGLGASHAMNRGSLRPLWTGSGVGVGPRVGWISRGADGGRGGARGSTGQPQADSDVPLPAYQSGQQGQGAAAAERGAADGAPAAGTRPEGLRPESLMMRLVDDFLFVTTSRAAAEAVVGRMQRGFPE